MMSDHQTEIAALEPPSIDRVRAQWRERFKSAPPAHRSKDLLVRAYAYELQVRAHGGLKRDIKRKLEELASRFTEDRAYTPPPPRRRGQARSISANGRRYAVTATEEGFLLDGRAYASLSAVAFAITGTKWNGPRFFRETSETRP